MSKLDEIILDQEIIVKALCILAELVDQPNSYFTKELIERLPTTQEIEMKKLVILENARNKDESNNDE